jgi:regulator of nucleoside diphosphate kinase
MEVRQIELVSPQADFHDGYTVIRERVLPSVSREPRRRLSILVTEQDLRRLAALIRREKMAGREHGLSQLEVQLAHAAIVDAEAVPRDVVTMNSRVVCEDERTGAWSRITLVYPSAATSHSDVSVLGQLGLSLLGAKVGQVIEVATSVGRAKRLRIRALPYQPERAGHFLL